MIEALESFVKHLTSQLDTGKRRTTKGAFKEASENYADSDEQFDGWLNLSLNTKFGYDFTLSELTAIRKQARTTSVVNEIAKNCLMHRRNLLIGDGLIYEVLKTDKAADPLQAARDRLKDSKAKKMMENWNRFRRHNKFDLRLMDAATLSAQDGEYIFRLFKSKDTPQVRYVDPEFLVSQGAFDLGVQYKPGDVEDIVGYFYKAPDDTGITPIKADAVVHIKRNVPVHVLRGVSDFYPIFTNLRRIDKVLRNTSILTQIQSAIALIRKHENSTQAQVSRLISDKSDGQARVDAATGKAINGRKFNSGTIIDAPKGVSYDYPSMSVDPERFLKTLIREMAHVAANFVYPVEWLLCDERSEPLLPGSPTVAHWKTEQAIFYLSIEELFWKVQGMNGVDVESIREKYDLLIFGPRLSTSKAVDEARIAQILLQVGSASPQHIARTFGLDYAINRADTIAHYETLQPGEPAPGSIGATNGSTHDGTTSTTGNVKPDNAPGGNTNV